MPQFNPAIVIIFQWVKFKDPRPFLLQMQQPLMTACCICSKPAAHPLVIARV